MSRFSAPAAAVAIALCTLAGRAITPDIFPIRPTFRADSEMREIPAGEGTAALPAPFQSQYGSPSAQRPRKVLIIGIDGLRSDAFRSASTPNLDLLKRDGALSVHTVTDPVARSGPGWTCVLTGQWGWKHHVKENGFLGYRRDLNPTFLDRLLDARPETVVGAVVNWKPLAENLFGGRGFWEAPGDDRAVAKEASRLIGKGLPDVLFVHFDGVDHAGHTFGFSPYMPFYIWAVEKVDRRIGELEAAVRARTGEDWLIVVTSDHGGTFRHHGANTPVDRTVFLLANGPGCARERPDGFRAVVDVAPTVFAYLGLPVSPEWKWDGKPLGYAPAPVSPRDPISPPPAVAEGPSP